MLGVNINPERPRVGANEPIPSPHRAVFPSYPAGPQGHRSPKDYLKILAVVVLVIVAIVISARAYVHSPVDPGLKIE